MQCLLTTYRLFEVTETMTGIYLMMEYAPGGELFVRLAEIGSYTESEAKPIFAQIASAIHYMVNLIRIVCHTTLLQPNFHVSRYHA